MMGAEKNDPGAAQNGHPGPNTTEATVMLSGSISPTDLACACGMARIPTEEWPEPYSLAWHVGHRTRHLARFPATDAVTRSNLDLFVAWAREREDPATLSPDFLSAREDAV